MKSEEFEKLVKKDCYQVFLCTSACSLPISFASHTWFVLNKNGIISRWEILHWKNRGEKNWIHLVFNLKAPFLGMTLFPIWSERKHFATHVLQQIEGDEYSIAKRMIDFIENSPNTYPYCKKYHLIGPNSNTYTQWVLNQFPDFKVELPKNAFGKNYRIK